MCEWGRCGASPHRTTGREIAKQESLHGLNELISTLSMRQPMAGEVMVSSSPEASVKLVLCATGSVWGRDLERVWPAGRGTWAGRTVAAT
jgi:hypothetical protein